MLMIFFYISNTYDRPKVDIFGHKLAKICLNEYPFSLLVDVRNSSLKTEWMNVGEKLTLPMDLELFFTLLENIHFKSVMEMYIY